MLCTLWERDKGVHSTHVKRSASPAHLAVLLALG